MTHNPTPPAAKETTVSETPARPTKAPRKSHDFRRRDGWGHSCVLMRRRDDGSWLACIFSSTPVEKGDLVLVNGKTGDLRYYVKGKPRWSVDPGDQYFATLVYMPEDEDA